jgi:TPR repeat protein
LKHYKLAADRGSPEAQLLFALFTFQSLSDDIPSQVKTERFEVGLKYLDLAVEQGDGTAQVYQGLDDLFSDDFEPAANLFKQAAQQLNVFGELCYGICQLFGAGTLPNAIMGVRYLDRVRTKGWAFPVFFGGLALHSVGVHAETAAEYFKFAAEDGMAVAQAYYAWALENGSGVKKDIKQAAEFYTKAVEAGFGPARAGLRRCTQSESL